MKIALVLLLMTGAATAQDAKVEESPGTICGLGGPTVWQIAVPDAINLDAPGARERMKPAPTPAEPAPTPRPAPKAP